MNLQKWNLFILNKVRVDNQQQQQQKMITQIQQISTSVLLKNDSAIFVKST